jgi:hypothetical protein
MVFLLNPLLNKRSAEELFRAPERGWLMFWLLMESAFAKPTAMEIIH